jgi:hypothetical protein
LDQGDVLIAHLGVDAAPESQLCKLHLPGLERPGDQDSADSEGGDDRIHGFKGLADICPAARVSPIA